MDPPGCPDLAFTTILMMSLLTWEAIFFRSSVDCIFYLIF